MKEKAKQDLEKEPVYSFNLNKDTDYVNRVTLFEGKFENGEIKYKDKQKVTLLIKNQVIQDYNY